MAKFHYIWMGRSPLGTKYEECFKDGPNDLARQVNQLAQSANRSKDSPNPLNQEIIMWIPEALIETIRRSGQLDSSITLKAVEDIYKNAKHLSKEEQENLEKTVELLGKNRAYSAQKDVVSAAILEEYGGYYLDTTTRVDSVEKLLINKPNEVWFPRISETDGTIHDDKTVILPDVWALYSPHPGEGTFKGMLNSYIQRCQYFFPKHYNIDKFEEGKSQFEYDDGGKDIKTGYALGDSGSGQELMLSEMRDEFIGMIVIHSFLDGLSAQKGALINETMKRLSSSATSTNEGKTIEEMGIHKRHVGSWRVQEVVQMMEDRRTIERSPQLMPQQIDSVREQRQEVKSRFHAFPVKDSNFKELKIQYRNMEGDFLKQKILDNFNKTLSTIRDANQLEHYIKNFKSSEDYKVLEKRQGVVSALLWSKTDSISAVEKMIQEKKSALEGGQIDAQRESSKGL